MQPRYIHIGGILFYSALFVFTGAFSAHAAITFDTSNFGEQAAFFDVSVTGAATSTPADQPFGVSFSALPPAQEADNTAKKLARFGVSLASLPAPGTGDATEQQFDNWFATLKRHGIYTAVRIHAGDDAIALPAAMQAASSTPPRTLERFFARKNPHTGTAYGQDSALAAVVLTGETAPVTAWKNGTLSTTPALQSAFNRWLTRQYESRAALREAWNTGEKEGLFRDEYPDEGTVELRDYAYKDNYNNARYADQEAFYRSLEDEYVHALETEVRSRDIQAPVVRGSLANAGIPPLLPYAAFEDRETPAQAPVLATLFASGWTTDFSDSLPPQRAVTERAAALSSLGLRAGTSRLQAETPRAEGFIGVAEMSATGTLEAPRKLLLAATGPAAANATVTVPAPRPVEHVYSLDEQGLPDTIVPFDTHADRVTFHISDWYDTYWYGVQFKGGTMSTSTLALEAREDKRETSGSPSGAPSSPDINESGAFGFGDLQHLFGRINDTNTASITAALDCNESGSVGFGDLRCLFDRL